MSRLLSTHTQHLFWRHVMEIWPRPVAALALKTPPRPGDGGGGYKNAAGSFSSTQHVRTHDVAACCPAETGAQWRPTSTHSTAQTSVSPAGVKMVQAVISRRAPCVTESPVCSAHRRRPRPGGRGGGGVTQQQPPHCSFHAFVFCQFTGRIFVKTEPESVQEQHRCAQERCWCRSLLRSRRYPPCSCDSRCFTRRDVSFLPARRQAHDRRSSKVQLRAEPKCWNRSVTAESAAVHTRASNTQRRKKKKKNPHHMYGAWLFACWRQARG